MYLRRFRNRRKLRLLDMQGRFSLMYLGDGTFLYTYPGKTHPVVRKIEFGRRRNRVRGLSVALLAAGLGLTVFFSRAGTADPVSRKELERMESRLTPIQLEEKTELLKAQLTTDPARRGKLFRGNKRIIEYVVKPGDSLGLIAQKLEVPMDVIALSSGIQMTSLLRPGQKLYAPYSKGLVYAVREGDRLAALAHRFYVPLAAIMRENPNLQDPNYVAPGTRIFLPNAKMPAPPPVWYAPVRGGVTQYYGWRNHPVSGRRHLHSGIDVGVRYGTVRAARDGHVTFAGYLGSYGHTIIVAHTGGYKTLYAHLSRLYVRRGQVVRARQKIARSGNSGITTGPHLHFEIIRYGRPMNPWKKVRFYR